MSTKRFHEYEVIFKYLTDNKGEKVDKEPIEFLFQNHDDVFNIVDVLTEKDLFENKTQSVQFAIGLKLFVDVMMKNKDHELFSEMRPAFIEFMKNLKGK